MEQAYLCQSWSSIHAAVASLVFVTSDSSRIVYTMPWTFSQGTAPSGAPFAINQYRVHMPRNIHHSHRTSSGAAEACNTFAICWALGRLQKPRIEHSWPCASSQTGKLAAWPSCMQVSG